MGKGSGWKISKKIVKNQRRVSLQRFFSQTVFLKHIFTICFEDNVFFSPFFHGFSIEGAEMVVRIIIAHHFFWGSFGKKEFVYSPRELPTWETVLFFVVFPLGE